ncbi:MAG: hypothetical protein FWD73_11785 [Polyangiaceae bacterium]|nr:hypothetical protein [Polyangiaceae bacterium]
MAHQTAQELSDRLFETFLAPLVLGGDVVPGKPFGGKSALAMSDAQAPANTDSLSQVTLARVHVARRLTPIDTLSPTPSATEWALAAMLHDLLQATHPGFNVAFRRSGPARIVKVVHQTLSRLEAPATVGEALSRHTWLARMFELTRTDKTVRWWTGHATFRGTEPPSRLLAWPKVRRVSQVEVQRKLMDLPEADSAVAAPLFTNAIYNFLRKTPLTDLATLTRAAPAFEWTPENLAFTSGFGGRTLALRALAHLPEPAVDAALGAATKALLEHKAMQASLVAIDVLRDRVLMRVSQGLGATADPLGFDPNQADAAFALCAGAMAANQCIMQIGLAKKDEHAIAQHLQAVIDSPTAKEVQALLVS